MDGDYEVVNGFGFGRNLAEDNSSTGKAGSR